ncbi:hypothetical protein [Streptomyces decoyicus]|uniref:hypothetical protein n=1 Tax=Streptomyces decoyicus TaxID=249567 RepID=UPI00069D4CDD|nr:hypothetical protein [Streptomyces decoyicus]KOG46825.1 hypothetical protein ADK74_10940 [Streptomyces decoyicus]QZY14349.1 hypothetical protein K7C20_03080 [Streptomyces decoyicus]
MPLDVFAALGALVRAELARNRPQPPRSPADEAVPQRPAIPAPPPPTEPPPTEPPPATAATPPPARPGLFARMIRKLAALFR